MTLLIMAAGMGSRFGGLKQIEPVGPNGEFIIDYSVYDAKLAGFTKVVFIIKEENYEIFKETIGKRFDGIIDVEYVFQKNDDIPSFVGDTSYRSKPWGTGHAILAAKNNIDENFAIINADDFYDRDAFFKMAEFLKISKENEYSIIGYSVENTITDAGSVKRGVLNTNNGYLVKLTESLIEKKDDAYLASPLDGSEPFIVHGDTMVSMNMIGFSPKIFEYLEEGIVEFFKANMSNLEKCEYLIPDVVSKLSNEGKVIIKVVPTTSVWLGMTYKEDKVMLVENIRKMIDKGMYPEKLN
ncbi:MAG: sugar phosphate nucleotidyltransferase [Bacilli bacterium]|nr:sugar phosphate nucleotidyltransferase [Bacilli bacterium]